MSYKEFTEFFVELINLKDVKDFRKDDYIKYLCLFDGFEHQCIKWTIEKYEKLMRKRKEFYHKVDYYAYFMWYIYHFCSNNIISVDTKIINDLMCNKYYYDGPLYHDRPLDEFDIQISDYVYDSGKDEIIEDKLGECKVIKFASVIVLLIRKTLANKKEFKCKFKTPMNIEEPASVDMVSTDEHVVIFEIMEKTINQYHTNITNLMKEYKSNVDKLIPNEYNNVIFEFMEKMVNQYHTNVTDLMKECKSKIKELSKK